MTSCSEPEGLVIVIKTVNLQHEHQNLQDMQNYVVLIWKKYKSTKRATKLTPIQGMEKEAELVNTSD